jgi:hypothetical protein
MGVAVVHIGNGAIRLRDDLRPFPTGAHKDLKAGTVRAIVRQLGISREEFGPIK